MEQLKFITPLLLMLIIITGTDGLRCNGMEGLCDLKVDQVTFPGAHNTGSDSNVAGPCLWRNQESNMVTQFVGGIQYFDIDTCWHEGKVKNCHCNSGVGCHHGTDMTTTLNQLDFWMKYGSSPYHFFNFRNEVIILHFNRDADITGEDAKKIGRSLAEMLTNLWDPNGSGDLKLNNYYNTNDKTWPTLRQAIESKQQIFVFMENGPAKYVYVNPVPTWLLQSNGFIGSTWTSIYVGPTYGCVDLSSTTGKCDTDKAFIELAAFGTHGLCTWDMSWHCSRDNGIGFAAYLCHVKRQAHGKTVNIMIVDYAVDNYETSRSVVERAKAYNQLNIQNFLR